MQETIQTQRIEILNGDGRVIATLGANDQGMPSLTMFHDHGRPAVVLELNEEGPASSKTAPRLCLNAYATNWGEGLSVDIGVDDGAGSIGFSVGGIGTTHLYVDSDGESGLSGIEAIRGQKAGDPVSTQTLAG